MMLRALKQMPIGDSKALKKAFLLFVKGDPTRVESYAEKFAHDDLQSMRSIETTIDKLLGLFGK
jgi:hypothetical protein